MNVGKKLRQFVEVCKALNESYKIAESNLLLATEVL